MVSFTTGSTCKIDREYHLRLYGGHESLCKKIMTRTLQIRLFFSKKENIGYLDNIYHPMSSPDILGFKKNDFVLLYIDQNEHQKIHMF